MPADPLRPPVARTEDHKLELHGDLRIDPYFWMRNREDPEVRAYLEAENAYTESVLRPVKGLRERLFREMTGRIPEKDSSVPYRSNAYWYYRRFEAGGEYPLYCRSTDADGTEESVMLDGNALSEGHAYFQVAGRSVSPDNRILAYGVDTVGRRIYTLRFRDLETGADLSDEIPGTTGHAAWADDNRTLFYTVRDEKTLRAGKIMRHRVGEPVERDVVVFDETDTTFYTGIYRSRTDRFLYIYAHSTLTSEYRVLETGDPEGEFRVVRPRVKGVEYDVEDSADRFLIRTNADGATNFKLISVPIENSLTEDRETVVPHRDDVLLEDFLCLSGHLVLLERRNGISGIRYCAWDAVGSYTPVRFEEEAHGQWFGANAEYDTKVLRFIYTSMTTPVSTFDLDLETGQRVLKKEQPVEGGFDKHDYRSKRLWVPVRDGLSVPVSLVYRKEWRQDGKRPLLLYGYGAYGNSMDPYFSPSRLSLLDRGFAFAIAHVRGGEELGRTWYETGKLLQKMNTFTDFIDIGEFLVEERYAAPDKLFAMGGSAGGLLVGAVMNMRPDLWRGVVAAVPFVDVITTMLDDSIPLTSFEYDEWGDPSDRSFYEYIRSYSPYDNVDQKAYPNVLITAGLHDSQVQYWEPAKWTAKLRRHQKGNNLILLHTHLDAGHSGASGRYRQFREVALEYAFLLFLLGFRDDGKPPEAPGDLSDNENNRS